MTTKIHKNGVELQLDDWDILVKQNVSIYDEYLEVTLKVDHCISKILDFVREMEKTCMDKKILKYFARLQYDYNQISGWRTEIDRGSENICDPLSWWHRDSLYQVKKLVRRFKKNPNYYEIYIKSADYYDRMKTTINSPRYFFSI